MQHLNEQKLSYDLELEPITTLVVNSRIDNINSTSILWLLRIIFPKSAHLTWHLCCNRQSEQAGDSDDSYAPQFVAVRIESTVESRFDQVEATQRSIILPPEPPMPDSVLRFICRSTTFSKFPFAQLQFDEFILP